MERQIFYMAFETSNAEEFFNNLRALMHLWKSDVSVHLTDDVLEELKSICNKRRVYWNEEAQIGKLTIKLKDKQYVDIIYNVKNDVESIGFGPMSDKKKREIYVPYKRKEISRRLYIYLK